jgi:hypothetical protein
MEDKQWVVSCLLGFDAVPPQYLTFVLPLMRQVDNPLHQEYFVQTAPGAQQTAAATPSIRLPASTFTLPSLKPLKSWPTEHSSI